MPGASDNQEDGVENQDEHVKREENDNQDGDEDRENTEAWPRIFANRLLRTRYNRFFFPDRVIILRWFTEYHENCRLLNLFSDELASSKLQDEIDYLNLDESYERLILLDRAYYAMNTINAYLFGRIMDLFVYTYLNMRSMTDTHQEEINFIDDWLRSFNLMLRLLYDELCLINHQPQEGNS